MTYALDERGDVDVTFLHEPSGMFTFPINLMIVDPHAKVARVVLENSGRRRMH